ncbi:MAG: alpha/beta hydrolase [Alphaproteobacteria bacterium]|nr:alpha/beta hydrolase [Alphaproteobacteria bacterium]
MGRCRRCNATAGVAIVAFFVAVMSTAGAQPVSIDPRFSEPEGWRWGEFRNSDGARIRFGSLAPANPIATAVLVGGFGEFSEKYFEVVRNLLARRIAVWQMDWRGQGGSERYLANPNKPFAAGYHRDVADLHQFASTVVRRPSGGAFFLIAHSMGGHIGLRYLHDFPATFDFAVLTAPMINIKERGGIPLWAARALALVARNLGFAEAYLPGGGDWSFDPTFAVEQSTMSQDPIRFRVARDYQQLKPKLRLGGTTFGWLDNAFRSITLLNEDSYLRTVRTPILMGTPLKEQVVQADAEERACQLMPRCEQMPLPNAKHEIWMERDEYRDAWLAAFDRYLAARLLQRR